MYCPAMGCGSSTRKPAAPAAYDPAPVGRPAAAPARPTAVSTTPTTPSRDKPAEELTGLSQQQRLRSILPEDASQYGLPTVLQKNVLFKVLPASVKNTHYGARCSRSSAGSVLGACSGEVASHYSMRW